MMQRTRTDNEAHAAALANLVSKVTDAPAAAGKLLLVSERGYRSREAAASAYARQMGLNGRGGWFRERDQHGLGAGPVVAQGLHGLARVADVHEHPDGFHYSTPAHITAPGLQSEAAAA